MRNYVKEDSMADRTQGQQGGNPRTRTTSTTASGSTTSSGTSSSRLDQPLGSSTANYGTTSASEESSSMADRARSIGQQAVGEVGERARGLFDDQKDRAVEGAHGLGRALRQTATTLRSENQTQTAHFIERAAEKIDELSGKFENRDLDQVIWDTQQFARRQPAVFFGGAIALGFIAARFLKASNERFRGYRSFDDRDEFRSSHLSGSAARRESGLPTTFATDRGSDFSTGGNVSGTGAGSTPTGGTGGGSMRGSGNSSGGTI